MGVYMDIVILAASIIVLSVSGFYVTKSIQMLHERVTTLELAALNSKSD